MVVLQKMFVARFIGKNKHPFATEKIVADSLFHAEEIADEWGTFKYPNRVKEIVVERSKGEVVTDAHH